MNYEYCKFRFSDVMQFLRDEIHEKKIYMVLDNAQQC